MFVLTFDIIGVAIMWMHLSPAGLSLSKALTGHTAKIEKFEGGGTVENSFIALNGSGITPGPIAFIHGGDEDLKRHEKGHILQYNDKGGVRFALNLFRGINNECDASRRAGNFHGTGPNYAAYEDKCD